MNGMWSLKQAIRDFHEDESGLILAEFVIVLPMLIWAFMALFVYWDVFRSMNTAQKGAYAISDLISRQNNDIPVSYLDGMQAVMEYILPANQNAKMRFTSVKWSVPNNRFEVIWSRSPSAAMPQMTTTMLQSYANQIPIMAPTDSVMIVESSVPYTTPIDVGLAASYVFDEFIVTRPRFLTKICLQGFACT
jgi:Flp pilus assembly protein TadG